LHLQEIATNFQKHFPPHPAAVPEACIFVCQQKKSLLSVALSVGGGVGSTVLLL
jgi:hypothetical protein